MLGVAVADGRGRVWQELGATRFMHNPELWGLLQFEPAAPGSATLCRNVEFPVRHALTQVYRAEREMMRLRGRYTEVLQDLLDPTWCDPPPPSCPALSTRPCVLTRECWCHCRALR